MKARKSMSRNPGDAGRTQRQDSPGIGPRAESKQEAGFTLVEALAALSILAFGLLAAGQLTWLALNSASLARTKCFAAVLAQNKAELLAERFQSNPESPELRSGDHGPETQEVVDPVANRILNRFAICWTVGDVPDPRNDVRLRAKLVSVTVSPVGGAGQQNFKSWLNKTVSLTTVVSFREVQ